MPNVGGLGPVHTTTNCNNSGNLGQIHIIDDNNSDTIIILQNCSNGSDLPTSPGISGVPGPPGPAGAPGEGVPSGGEPGEILIKITNTDYDLGWTTFSQALKKQSSLTNDGTFLLLAGQTLISLMVDPSENLYGFKIGTTPGGDDIVSNQNLISTGEWIPYSLNLKFKTNKILYISGISGVVNMELLII